MDYPECLAYIESLSPTLEKPSLNRISVFLACHADWQNQYDVLHVAGTNGKGSTVALLDSIVRAGKLKVGRFTGPHLVRWNERFHLDGKAISDLEFARVGTHIRSLSEEFGRTHPDLGPLTWFEYLTVMAFYWFAENQVDLAVIEVGLGGRFDATNVVNKVLCSIITNIDLDHTHILGNTVEQIAFEKAGIIKRGVPVVTGATGAALQVIRARANELMAPLHVVDFDDRSSVPKEIVTVFEDAKASLSLQGSYQERNGLLSVTAFYVSGIASRMTNPVKVIQTGFKDAFWPGRMQFVRDLNVLLDGAHNPAGASALRAAIDRMYPGATFQFVIGCFENKNAEKLVDALVRPGDRVYASQASTKRATYDKDKLAAFCEERGAVAATFETIALAFHAARIEQNSRLIVVTGSFATVREVMFALGWNSVEDGRSECVKISDDH